MPTSLISPGVALLLGAFIALTLGNPFARQTKKLTPRLLALCVVGLGAGMDLGVVLKVGASGLLYTFISITLTVALGIAFGKLLAVPRTATLLLSGGTAICGGSAIAALAPTLGAKDEEISVSLATVFLLNGLALFLFPTIGRTLQMDQTAFGLWSALAIHDTSSVVGASLQYGSQALAIATTVKLARALWILPLVIALGALEKTGKRSFKIPWFIGGFLVASALVTVAPTLQPLGHQVANWAKALMSLTLFLIGLGLSKENLKRVGVRPLVLGAVLWVVVASATLAAVQSGWIRA